MTLSQTAVLTKNVITISIFALVLSISSFIGYKIWYAYYLAHLPPVEEKADIKFGMLPAFDFPKSSVSSSNFSYSLDTSTGNLPKLGVDPGFDKIMKVYFIPKSYTSLLSPQKSQELANKFKITSDPEVLSETKYRFSDQGKILTVDLDTNNFFYKKDATISAKEAFEEDNKLVSGFETILNTLGVLTDDLKKGRTKITFLKNVGNSLIPTSLKTEAVAVQISLWRENIDQKSIVTPDFNKALINAIFTKSSSDLENYIQLQFVNYPIDISTFATYKIKDPETAFADLREGKGVIVLEPPKPQVSISSIYLGYFLSDNYSPYLQPIYVFEGQDFVGYIPAVSQEYINQTKQN